MKLKPQSVDAPINFIQVYDDALSEEFCKHVIDKFEADDNKRKGVVGFDPNDDQVIESVKQSTDLRLNIHPHWKEENQQFFEAQQKGVMEYMEYLISYNQANTPFIGPNIVDSGFQVQRTEPGQFYDWHNDSNIVQYFVNRDVFHRFFTYIFYLNDIDVENDGYTEFIDGTRIQPKRGRVAYFPATWTYLHRGVTPKNQTKYICTGWMGNLHDEFKQPSSTSSSKPMMDNNFE